MKTIKVFVSQPMAGKTDEEILERRKELLEEAKTTFTILRNDGVEPVGIKENEEFELEAVDNFIEGVADDPDRIFYLGMSISQMNQADYIIFDVNWVTSLGCNIEREIAKQYGLEMMDLGSEEKKDEPVVEEVVSTQEETIGNEIVEPITDREENNIIDEFLGSDSDF